MSPAKHSSGSVTDGRTDRQTDGQTTDKVIPMCHYALQATQKVSFLDRYLFGKTMSHYNAYIKAVIYCQINVLLKIYNCDIQVRLTL